MKVYAVMIWNYSDTCLVDVFTSREEAEKYAAKKNAEDHQSNNDGSYSVEEREVK